MERMVKRLGLVILAVAPWPDGRVSDEDFGERVHVFARP